MMTDVLGGILPLAVGVAISPIPIIAIILMLLSPSARTAAVGFVVGWVLGIVVAVTLFTLIGTAIPAADPDAAKPVQGVIHLVFGALLIGLGIAQMRHRGASSSSKAPPKWMQAIDRMSFPGAFGLGALLAAVNPKNTMMTATAGITIGTPGISVGSAAIAIAGFTVIAASTVVVPALAYLLAADRLGGRLVAVREWLEKENTVIMAVLLLALGPMNIGKGIALF
ncbi:GAP family protein [Microbacterium sp. LWO14-1.2]|uniref:GAP family protein n=1 Tax=Microbacterium sp. LWO14-1.2 TaxID=3135263 RepID=UPI0031398FE1